MISILIIAYLINNKKNSFSHILIIINKKNQITFQNTKRQAHDRIVIQSYQAV